ncbi:hypothetical protein L484_023048 [Morus notabilis]|uniref:Uncharacterized protein n=1 Tax=Morus notabilis TaxID=981085 RepID=W9RK60_9ROSA|nr:hypothetical protein L484_023048 [Morus notabilis]
MGFIKILSGLFQILGESFKICFRNWKLISSMTLFHIFLNSILSFPNLFSATPSVANFPTNKTTVPPLDINNLDDSPYANYFFYLFTLVKMTLKPFFGVKFVVLIANSLVSLFFATTIILASTTNSSAKGLHVKKFLTMVVKSWKRTLLTSFYAALLGLVYAFFVLALLFLYPTINPRSLILLWITISVVTTAPILCIYYIYVVWNLALVVSVLKEKGGIEALKRASEILKGFMLKGFLLNLLLEILPASFTPYLKLEENFNRSDLAEVFLLFFIFQSISSVAIVFSLISHTVLYYECKKIHGKSSNEILYTIPLIISACGTELEKNILLRSTRMS